MLRALIADDERSAGDVLQHLLEATGRVEVVARASDGVECLRKWEELSPDALFLDIRMPKVTGIEVAEIVLDSEDPPLVAFITGHDGYAVRAFELAAVDYVVKSIDLAQFQERIGHTVERMERALARGADVIDDLRDRVAQMSRLLANITQQPALPSRLPIKDYEEGTLRLIEPNSVIYAERRDRRVILHTREREFPTYFTIDRLEHRLQTQGFVRANPGALVNLRYIDHLIPNGDGSYDVVLKDEKGTTITASRSRAKALLESLQP